MSETEAINTTEPEAAEFAEPENADAKTKLPRQAAPTTQLKDYFTQRHRENGEHRGV